MSKCFRFSTLRVAALVSMEKFKRVFTLACNLLLFLGLTAIVEAQPGTITTVAGTGVAGFSGDGGPATAARINSPRGVIMDGAGNLYIADRLNHRVRKVDIGGNITTVVGTGVAGFSGDGGPAILAQLNEPTGLALDGAGNLYIIAEFNHRVRKVDTGGIITTVAGTGVAGFSGDGGPATSARLNRANEIDIDGAGNLYISDQFNHRIRKVDTGGIITTVAGIGTAGFSGDGGPATSARLNFPTDMRVDGTGNLCIADAANHRVRKVNTSGIITTIAGTGVAGFSGDGGLATSARLNEPIRLLSDLVGNLYIADRANDRVRKVNPSGIITTIAGTGIAGFSGDGGPATAAQLNLPTGLAFDVLGNLYIGDRANHRVRKIFEVRLTANAGTDNTICAGTSIALGAIPATTGGTLPYSFNWTASPPDPSLTSPTDENPIVSPIVTTTYTLTVTDTDLATDTDEVTVKVNALPTAAVSGDASICAGGSTTLTATLTGTGPWNITWSDAVTQNGIVSSPATRVVNPANTTTYMVTSVADANCTGTSSGSATVTINPSPTATVSGDVSICAGSSATLTATLTGTGPWNITWSDAVTQTGIVSSPATRVVNPASTTTFTITNITNANGCSNSGSGSAVITVNPLPTAMVSGDATICTGGSATLSAVLTGTGPWNITWSDAVTQNGIASSPATRVVSPASTTTYTVTAVSDANCIGTSSGSATITINPSPTTTVSGSTSICTGGSATLSAALTGAGPWNITWSDAVSQNGIASSPATRVVNPASTTTYTVTSVSDANCTGTSLGSTTVTVHASNPPVIGSIIVPVNPTLINTAINASASFTDATDNGDHSATWSWGDNSTSAGIVNEGAYTVLGSHIYTAAGVYTVTLTVTDGYDNSGEGTATEFVVIYDPSAGFVTGGGWIDSPAGAYVPNLLLTGKANFGFVSKYQKGKTTPDGNTTFHFNTADFKFKSTSYEWLVIAGPNAKYKGVGTVNNSGNYGFMLTGRDGQVNGGGGVDRFRIKIWDKNNGDAVVYDNQMNDPDDGDATDAIEGGSIAIHNSSASKAAQEELASEVIPESYALEQNYPNPFNPSTTIQFDLPEAGNVTLKIYNSVGQLVRTLAEGDYASGRYEAVWNGKEDSGAAAASGIYFYRLAVQNQSGGVAFTETRKMALVK